MTKNQDTKFYRVNEVAEILHVSVPTAYRIMRNLNKDLKSKGFQVVSGRISRRYFQEKIYV